MSLEHAPGAKPLVCIGLKVHVSGNLLGRLGRDPHRVQLVSLRSRLSKGKGERIWAPAHTGYFLVSDYLPKATSNSSHFILGEGPHGRFECLYAPFFSLLVSDARNWPPGAEVIILS